MGGLSNGREAFEGETERPTLIDLSGLSLSRVGEHTYIDLSGLCHSV